MKKSLIALLVMTVLTACVGCKSFRINVNLDNSTDKTVYLNRMENGKMVTIDSLVAKNKTVVFKMKQSDNNDALHIMMDGWRRPLVFFADNQDVTITGDCQKYGEIKVTASETQQKLNEITAQINLMEDDEEIHFATLVFVKENIDKPVGLYVLYRYKWAFELEEFEYLYENVPAEMQSGYKQVVEKYIADLKRTQPGEPYIDFAQTDVNGDVFKMSSLVGYTKIIILDFWASWCPDCRKANPDLVKIYNEFKDKGLEIVSVSLDTDETAWKNAIEKDGLAWPFHVSDLKGWNNEVAQMYTIAFIPQNLIIGKDGLIIEKNLPFEKMEDFLSNTLN